MIILFNNYLLSIIYIVFTIIYTDAGGLTFSLSEKIPLGKNRWIFRTRICVRGGGFCKNRK